MKNTNAVEFLALALNGKYDFQFEIFMGGPNDEREYSALPETRLDRALTLARSYLNKVAALKIFIYEVHGEGETGRQLIAAVNRYEIIFC